MKRLLLSLLLLSSLSLLSLLLLSLLSLFCGTFSRNVYVNKRWNELANPGTESPGSKTPATPAPRGALDDEELQENRRSAKNGAKCAKKNHSSP